MKNKIICLGFYWSGYSESINNFIKNCGVCHSEMKEEKLPKKPKIIITNGPHIRYQADLWYLDSSLKENTPFLYCLDIIDHFSKWLGCYLLKNKTSDLVVSKIKSFISSNGVFQIFQTDNGTEFNNLNLKIFLGNLDIIYLRSAPYHPQSNGCCQAVHKEVKKFLLDEKEKKKDSFDLEIAIENAIEFHNNRKLESTSYEPKYLRNIDSKNIIDDAVNNIFKSMQIKIKKNYECPSNTMLLLSSEIELNGCIYKLVQHKGKKKFIIPFLLRKYINDITISIYTKINYEQLDHIKKDTELKVHIDTYRINDDFGFQYYMDYFGEKLEIEDVRKLVLFEE